MYVTSTVHTFTGAKVSIVTVISKASQTCVFADSHLYKNQIFDRTEVFNTVYICVTQMS